MTRYPHYSTWRCHTTGVYEIVRWRNRTTFDVIQSNICTREKASQALAIWRERELIHRRIQELATMAADMHAINLKLERDIDAR